MMEALQMVKFSLRKEHLDFTTGWKTSERDMLDDDVEEDLLQRVLQTGFHDQLDSVVKIINAYED
jgi:hypothetical protein